MGQPTKNFYRRVPGFQAGERKVTASVNEFRELYRAMVTSVLIIKPVL